MSVSVDSVFSMIFLRTGAAKDEPGHYVALTLHLVIPQLKFHYRATPVDQIRQPWPFIRMKFNLLGQ